MVSAVEGILPYFAHHLGDIYLLWMKLTYGKRRVLISQIIKSLLFLAVLVFILYVY